jgi:hypothetical protein
MSDSSRLVRCHRCRRRASPRHWSDWPNWSEWEEIDGDPVCPGCLSGEEEQALVDQYLAVLTAVLGPWESQPWRSCHDASAAARLMLSNRRRLTRWLEDEMCLDPWPDQEDG